MENKKSISIQYTNKRRNIDRPIGYYYCVMNKEIDKAIVMGMREVLLKRRVRKRVWRGVYLVIKSEPLIVNLIVDNYSHHSHIKQSFS